MTLDNLISFDLYHFSTGQDSIAKIIKKKDKAISVPGQEGP
jgi:hypothetical protein